MKLRTVATVGAYRNTGLESTREFRSGIPAYRPESEFFNEIYKACFFNRGRFCKQDIEKKKPHSKKDKKRTKVVLDAMAGPGRLGKDLRRKHRKDKMGDIQIVFQDARGEALRHLERSGESTIQCDIRNLKCIAEYAQFDACAVRFGLKDLPKNDIIEALESILAVLGKKGRLAIGDFIAKDERMQECMNRIIQVKQRLAGRTPQEGICHVPTKREWAEMMIDAGFVIDYYKAEMVSVEPLTAWKMQIGGEYTEREITEIMKKDLGELWKDVESLNLKMPGDEVIFTFPIVVFGARKPKKAKEYKFSKIG